MIQIPLNDVVEVPLIVFPITFDLLLTSWVGQWENPSYSFSDWFLTVPVSSYDVLLRSVPSIHRCPNTDRLRYTVSLSLFSVVEAPRYFYHGDRVT